MVERPAPQGEVLGAARADMDAQPLAPGPVMQGDETLSPLQLGGREENLVLVPGQKTPDADGFQQGKVVFNRVFAIVLLEGTIDQPPVPTAGIVILMADAHARIDEAGHGTINHAALGIGVEGVVVPPPPQLP